MSLLSHSCKDSLREVLFFEKDVHCSFENDFKVFLLPQVFDCCSYRWPCLKHVEEQHYSACLLEHVECAHACV